MNEGDKQAWNDLARAVWYAIKTVGVIAVLIITTIVMMSSCATPVATEQQHHHSSEADSLAVQAQMDERLSAWSRKMDSLWKERMEQYFSQQQQNEHHQETINETITTTTDSLGREIRQEQRSVKRDITREMQQTEQRLAREMETRLQTALDSMSSLWQTKYDSLHKSQNSADSTLTSATPVPGDNRPWYRRFFDALGYIALGAIVAGVGTLLWRAFNR